MEHTTHLIGLHDDAVGLLALLAAPLEGTQRCSHLALIGQNLIANFADQDMYVSRASHRRGHLRQTKANVERACEVGGIEVGEGSR